MYIISYLILIHDISVSTLPKYHTICSLTNNEHVPKLTGKDNINIEFLFVYMVLIKITELLLERLMVIMKVIPKLVSLSLKNDIVTRLSPAHE